MGQNRQEVCGVDGQTYASHCHSEAAGVAIDYIDTCREVPYGTPTGESNSGKQNRCNNKVFMALSLMLTKT